MILISYDISDNKKRNKFSNYIKKYGHRLQYSVFQIDNSERILKNIIEDINNKFKKTFSQEDSVYIFNLSDKFECIKWGYASNEDEDIIIIK